MRSKVISGFFGLLKQKPNVANTLMLGGAGLGVGTVASRCNELENVANGDREVAPESRLGAFKATLGYDRGTVGYSVNRAIGLIYLGMGTFGEERIGEVFNSEQAKEHYPNPVDGPSSLVMAEQEFSYWSEVKRGKPWSPGAQIATAFPPEVRDVLQREVFSRSPI